MIHDLVVMVLRHRTQIRVEVTAKIRDTTSLATAPMVSLRQVTSRRHQQEVIIRRRNTTRGIHDRPPTHLMISAPTTGSRGFILPPTLMTPTDKRAITTQGRRHPRVMPPTALTAGWPMGLQVKVNPRLLPASEQVSLAGIVASGRYVPKEYASLFYSPSV